MLEPKGVLYSSSFYFDFSSIWKDRAKLFPKVQADGLTAFDKSSGRVLGGVKISKLRDKLHFVPLTAAQMAEIRSWGVRDLEFFLSTPKINRRFTKRYLDHSWRQWRTSD